jgi:transposase
MEVPPQLLTQAPLWPVLKRWERRELAESLRRLGLSYREIGQIIPVSRGTLSAWCRDIQLSPEQEARLRALNNAKASRLQAGLGLLFTTATCAA